MQAPWYIGEENINHVLLQHNITIKNFNVIRRVQLNSILQADWSYIQYTLLVFTSTISNRVWLDVITVSEKEKVAVTRAR